MHAANDVKSHPYLLTMFACQKILMGLSLIYPYPFLYSTVLNDRLLVLIFS